MSDARTVREKLQAIIGPRSGATDGERENARQILARLDAKHDTVAYSRAVEFIDRLDPRWHPEGWRSPDQPAMSPRRVYSVRRTVRSLRYYASVRRPVALIRALYHDAIGGHEGELCQMCGRKYWPVVWRADDELWMAVHGTYSGLLCPACFDREATSKGIDLRWKPVRFER